MGLIFYQGKLLIVDGKLAMDLACCCGGGGCCEFLIKYTSLWAEILYGPYSETIELTGSPTQWTGTSTLESIFGVAVSCVSGKRSGQARFRCCVLLSSSAPCEFDECQDVDADCDPVDVVFNFSPPANCQSPVMIRITSSPP